MTMTARVVDLGTMSIPDIDALIDDCYAAKKARKDGDLTRVRAEIEAQARNRGFTLEEVLGLKSKKRKRQQKWVYRHPDNPGLTWSGFGMQPFWLKSVLAEGKNTLEELREAVS